ncbi:protein prenylyltransferase [Amylocystis lapponica]|nr:protein prenylyltransferase [Amylocystis lapponica]
MSIWPGMRELDLAQMVMRLGALLNTPPLSLEIIPGDGSEWFSEEEIHDSQGPPVDFAPFLYMEHHLGVPQKVLYKAYLVAATQFAQAKLSLDLSEFGSVSIKCNTTSLIHSSAIILLANPAHQTALNARKRLLRHGGLDAANELCFTAALLDVRDCSKQSILWHHRRWLLRRIHKPPGSKEHTSASAGISPQIVDIDDTLRDLPLPLETLRHEFSVVAKACETYRRNYFAWTHRYLCFEALIALVQSRSSDGDSYRMLLSDELLASKQWVERHVSDYTAVQYLHRIHDAAGCLLRTEPPALVVTDGPSACNSGPTRSPSLLAHARSLVEAYPDHETLWLYLRAALSSPSTIAHPPADLEAFARRFLLSQKVDGVKVSALSAVDAQLVHMHACRFLAWSARQAGQWTAEGACLRRIMCAASDDPEVLQMLGVDSADPISLPG